MAIGDSIYNGTRSLTTNAELAALSVPAQVARAFGWDERTAHGRVPRGRSGRGPRGDR